MKIKEEVLDVLAECAVENCVLYLPQIQLERKMYEAVNKVLTNIGGKWNRSAKGHVFDHDPTEELENLLLTGETEDMKKTFQFFPTPRAVAEIMCDLAELEPHFDVLEPSCGAGDLADVIYERGAIHLFCNEINRAMDKYLANKPYTATIGDFLLMKPGEIRPFDRIVMNPPFSKQQDIMHIYHAYDLLKPGGILVSVVSLSPFFRSNKKSVEFRDWLTALNAEIIDVEAGAFKSSGTMVATKIIKLKRVC